MNYRHAFHAGNFADLVKHATLTLLLDALTRAPEPLTVIDTHAGAGAYDLEGAMALKSQEAAIARLLADDGAPEGYEVLKAAVARANPHGGARIYPGSPAIAAAAMRPQDQLIACEMRQDDFEALEAILSPLSPQARALKADGFVTAPERTPRQGQVLVIIDPPFERGDDYQRAAETAQAVIALNPTATVAVWTPLKDLDTFDRFLTRMEALPDVLVAEVRLRPLTDPMKMNGCAMVIVGAPDGLSAPLEAIFGWAAQNLGEAGNEARIWRL